MESGKPSRTAWRAAAHRAAHQVLEQGHIFADPLTLRILSEDAETVVRDAGEQPEQRRLRIFIAVRTRFSEDALAIAVEAYGRLWSWCGTGHIWYRNTLPSPSRIFEVDHPATQAWKRQCLEDAAIAIPDSLTFAPVDFERQTLAQGLAAAGFDPKEQTFFTCCVVPPRKTVWSTLSYIAELPNGAHIVFDYSNPSASLSDENRASHESVRHVLPSLARGGLLTSKQTCSTPDSKDSGSPRSRTLV